MSTAVVPHAPPPARRRSPGSQRSTLRRYHHHGEAREIVALPGRAGATRVIDRRVADQRDQRLLEELPADEPPENAALLADRYLDDRERCRCADLPAIRVSAYRPPSPGRAPIIDGDGTRYRIARYPAPDGEYRWVAIAHGDRLAQATPVTLRHVVGAVEAYEPALARTRSAIARVPAGTRGRLIRDLDIVCRSPFVLNRALREAVLDALAHGHTRSEIAIRCGRVRHNHGNADSGETTWLSRRIGVIPAPGEAKPTPWVEASVLGLIAWQGLGIAPIHVELH